MHHARCFTSELRPLHPTCSTSRQHVERVARWRVQKSHEPSLSHAAPPPLSHAHLLLSPRHTLSRCCAALRDCLLTPCSSSGSALPLAPSRYAHPLSPGRVSPWPPHGPRTQPSASHLISHASERLSFPTVHRSPRRPISRCCAALRDCLYALLSSVPAPPLPL